jgi:hypothetical protein
MQLSRPDTILLKRFRKAAHLAVDQICDYFESLKTGEQDVQSRWEPGTIRDLVSGTAFKGYTRSRQD